jgi:putative PEP-CTERM system TPR-repeat lipoprotein
MIRLSVDAGRAADALGTAREVQRQRPSEPVGYALEGDIRVSQKAWPEAVTAYRNGLKNASAPELAMRLDAVLRQKGTPAEADTFAAGWLREHPQDRAFRFYLAEVATGSKDYARAAMQYKAILDIQPDDWYALNNLASVSSQLNDPKALEYAEKASKLAPTSAAVLDTLSRILIDRGDVKGGLDAAQRAVAIAPKFAEIRLTLARALIKDGQKSAAKKELEGLAQLGDQFAGQAEVRQLMVGL